MSDPRVTFWEAVHQYVRSCGGDPDRYVYFNHRRQQAVVQIEQLALKMSNPAGRTCMTCGHGQSRTAWGYPVCAVHPLYGVQHPDESCVDWTMFDERGVCKRCGATGGAHLQACPTVSGVPVFAFDGLFAKKEQQPSADTGPADDQAQYCGGCSSARWDPDASSPNRPPLTKRIVELESLCDDLTKQRDSYRNGYRKLRKGLDQLLSEDSE